MEKPITDSPAETTNGEKTGILGKIRGEFREGFGMFLYLWVLFVLFAYHKANRERRIGWPRSN